MKGEMEPLGNHSAMFDIDFVAMRLELPRRTIRRYIRWGWIEAVPVRYRKRRGVDALIPTDWRIKRSELRRLERDGVRPGPDGLANRCKRLGIEPERGVR